jgi:hypothetical protein
MKEKTAVVAASKRLLPRRLRCPLLRLLSRYHLRCLLCLPLRLLLRHLLLLLCRLQWWW